MGRGREVATKEREPKCFVGFALYRTEPSQEAFESVELLLPTSLRWRLLEERRLLSQARAEERLLAAAEERARWDRERVSRPIAPQLSEEEVRLRFIKAFERGVARRDPARRHPVLEANEILRVVVKIGTVRNKDDHKRELELIEKVKGRGALREIANPVRNSARWNRALSDLRSNHPHFLAVTNFVAEHVALSACSKRPLVIPAIHLWGPPGIGKSHYANDLAIALGAPLRRHSMENAQTTALLLGTERHWSTATPGIIFDQIVLGQYANPIFLIDELDKAPKNSGYDPITPLHSLMEPFTAATVRDAALDITFDASLAIYVATSNDPKKIPESLRSRLTEFEILPPRGDAALQVARVVASRTVEQLSIPGFNSPEPRVAHKLAHLAPRAIRRAVEVAVARALVNDRLYLKVSDLPDDDLDDGAPRGVLH